MKCAMIAILCIVILASPLASSVMPSHTLPPHPPNWKRATYYKYADQYAEQFGVPIKVYHKLIFVESSWDRNKCSKAGACGLTQINEITARHFGVTHTMWNPRIQLRAGARILANYTRRCGGLRAGLIAYNEGPSTCDSEYADSIMEVD